MPAPEQRVAAIRNAAWWVRWYSRPHQLDERESAIRTLSEMALASGSVDLIAEAIRAVLL